MSAGHFPTTAWSMVRAAQDVDGSQQREAMNRWTAAYWRPVFYFIRARGYPLHRAEDLTQEFFLRFFERDWISRADQQRGRFRTFLLTILTRFLADQGKHRARRQETFDSQQVAISALLRDSDRSFEPPVHRTPEQIFMRQWAHSVLAQVQHSMESWCAARGRPDWYRMFLATYFPGPGRPKFTQDGLAEHLRVSRDQVRYGLKEVEQKFIEFLRAELADQVDSPDELDQEIRELRELLGN